MFDSYSHPDAAPGVTTEWLRSVLGRLQDDGGDTRSGEALDTDTASRASELIDQIALLQSVGSAVQAAQVRRTAEFAALREAELARVGTAAQRDRARRDIGAQVGLARRVGPHLGTRLVGLAKVLSAEMPATMDAFRRGRIDEYQALLLVAETAALSLEHRREVDAELAADLGTLTAKQARAKAARIAYRLDPEQAVRRARKAYADRRVTVRPAPDTMTYLTALLPAVEGAGVYAALRQHAASANGAGDPRGIGALMADELVTRLLQPAAAASYASLSYAPPSDVPEGDVVDMGDGMPAVPPGVHVEIQLVMTDRTLFDGDMEPAVLSGYGPIPAPLARRLVRCADEHTRTWVRRLYTDHTGRITDADSRRRLFTETARQFLVARDQVCRTSWCDAPIRHADHVVPHAEGGRTDVDNGAGLCAGCNQTKEQPGWESRVEPDGAITTTTPSGHRYRSRPPDPPRSVPWDTDVIARVA